MLVFVFPFFFIHGDCALVHQHAWICVSFCASVREPHQAILTSPHRNRFEGGSFYLGVRGKGVGRGGVFTASTEESSRAFMSWLDSGSSPQGGQAASRYLLSNRDIFYDNVYSAEMASVGAEPVTQGLWLTRTPLPRHILAAMGSMRCNTTTRHIKQCYAIPDQTALRHTPTTITAHHSTCTAAHHSAQQSKLIHAIRPCLLTFFFHTPLTTDAVGF